VHVNWGALASVFFIALVAVVGVTGMFAIGVRGLSARVAARDTGGSGSSGFATAMLCFSACVVVVGYGIYLIVAA
jgi:hypothetical protein